MKKIIDIIHGIAVFLIFGADLCADSLGETPGGFVALFAIVCVAGALVLLGNHLEDVMYRQRRAKTHSNKYHSTTKIPNLQAKEIR